MRIAFLGTTGRFSRGVLGSITEEHEVVLVGLADRRREHQALKSRVAAGLRRLGLLLPLARRVEINPDVIMPVRSGDDRLLLERLRRVLPDLICVAGFPWLLSAAVYSLPRFGAINVHGSLLPRHRGLMPLFWIYYHDDRESGISLHRICDEADAGEIIAQERFEIPRGFPVDCLNEQNTRAAEKIIANVVQLIESGTNEFRMQDENLATAAPRIRKGERYADFASWDTERTWHFLAGLQARYHEPLYMDGRLVTYESVVGYDVCSHVEKPGSLRVQAKSVTAYCHDGVVELALPSRLCRS